MGDFLIGLNRRDGILLTFICLASCSLVVLILKHLLAANDAIFVFSNAQEFDLTKQIFLLFFLGSAYAFFQLIIGASTFGLFSTMAIATLPLLNGSSFFEIIFLYLIAILFAAWMKLVVFKKLFFSSSVELILVISMLAMLSFFLNLLSIEINLTIFELIVLIHLIERFFRIVEENKFKHGIKLLLETFVVATLISFFGNFLINFSQENFWIFFMILISFVVAIGNYTGLRMFEMFRFSSLRKK